ncbi:MAG: hypothetical protein R2806_04555 [Saprospiraceae bacterium]
MKLLFKFTNLTLACLLAISVSAQIEKTKTLEKDYPVQHDQRLYIGHRGGKVQLLPSNDGQVHIKGTIKVKADDESNAVLALNNMDIRASQSGNEININSDRNIKNWITVLNKSTITFESGDKAKNIRDVDMVLEVRIPDNLAVIEVKNKYDPIYVDQNIKGQLRIEQYDSEVRVADCTGPFTLNLKYGEATLGNVNDLSMEIYDSDITYKSARHLSGNLKYSDVKGGDLSQLTLETYDSEFRFGNIAGPVKITDKYSSYEMGNLGDLTFDGYECNLTIGDAKSFTGKSKYGEYHFKHIGNMDLESSYEDEYTGDRIDRLKVNSKYGEYKINTVGTELIFPESYEDEITLERFEKLTRLEMNAKYLELRCNQTSGDFTVTADAKYSEIELPSRTQIRLRDKENSQLKLEATVGGTSGKATFNCYECDITLN